MLIFVARSGAEVRQSYGIGKMLQHAYLLAKICFDTSENEPSKVSGMGLIGIRNVYKLLILHCSLPIRKRKESCMNKDAI